MIKQMGITNNVLLRVVDLKTNQVVSQHIGHNQATNSMLAGVTQYLKGTGTLTDDYDALSQYVPKYISLGTMGLYNQEEDENGLPTGIGTSATQSEEDNFKDYMKHLPGYGADGYDAYLNNDRDYFGLGPAYKNRESENTVNCELITDTFPRTQILSRQVLPQMESESNVITDVVFATYISTGALAKFRESGKDYVYITEVGLWGSKEHTSDDVNSLLAGYRIVPPNQDNWNMSVNENRNILKQNILRVGKNQIVQILWKIQIYGDGLRNSPTRTLLKGIGHYLCGDGYLNQGSGMFLSYLPRFISVGTSGLYSQDMDSDGLPTGIGKDDTQTEEYNFNYYMSSCPTYDSDSAGGIGPKYTTSNVSCELISDDAPRVEISYREVLDETESEIAETMDVVYAAMIPAYYLSTFFDDKDYIFITECGLWNTTKYSESGKGLLAGYRIIPTDTDNYDMSKQENRDLLKSKIVKVVAGQSVQVIWKFRVYSVNPLSNINQDDFNGVDVLDKQLRAMYTKNNEIFMVSSI